MSKVAIIGISAYGLLMWFGLHGAACAAHMSAVETYWSRGGNTDKFRWSHAYCKAMSEPIRFVIGYH